MMGRVPSVAHKYSPFFLQSLSSPPQIFRFIRTKSFLKIM
jgi:hypothetical protein